jgi:hypothetical protein
VDDWLLRDVPQLLTCMKMIPLTQGQVALVDDEDYASLSRFKWLACFVRSTGTFIAKRYLYCVRNENGKWKSVYRRMHRDILPAAKQIDHANLNTLDNRRQNLRCCTSSENLANRRKLRRNCQSRYKGVCRNKRGWRARCGPRGNPQIGTFESETEAAQAYNRAAVKLYGVFARLNVITEREGY